MITQGTIQQITSRIDIIEIVGEYVKLKKRGANYLGNCPFHNEKTPSFTVSPSKEIYKCFGCGKSGNAIGFLMEHEKFSYVEALKWLATKYNIEVEESEVSPEVKIMQQAADSLYIINAFAQKHFTAKLFENEEGQDVALSYLKHRGFREDIIHKFQLGYNLEQRNDFTQAAIKNQFNIDLLQKSGLTAIRNEVAVDNYRGRIIFPVHNNTGKIIGFGARVIKSTDRAPKYINTPENEIYIKSKILYGTYFARQTIDKLDECLLVEGYTDVISLHQAGIENVVASGGTSLTIDQLRLVRKYTNNLIILYDGDAAGIKAALRGLDLALEEGLNVKLVLLPENEDPDSFVNKIGTSAFRDFINKNKKDFILFQLDVMLKDAGNDTAKRSAVVNQVAESLSKINKAEDFTKQQDYVRQISEILKIDEGGLTTLVNKFKRDKLVKEESKSPHQPQVNIENITEGSENENFETALLFNNDDAQERHLLRVLIEFGLKPWDEEKTMAEYVFEELSEFHFDNPELEHVYETYRSQYEQGLQPTNKTLLYVEDSAVRNLLIQIFAERHDLSPNWDKKMEGLNINNRDVSRDEIQKSTDKFKLRKLKKMIAENEVELQKAQEVKNYDEVINLINIHKELKELEKVLTSPVGTVINK
jgi:DNA primase